MAPASFVNYILDTPNRDLVSMRYFFKGSLWAKFSYFNDLFFNKYVASIKLALKECLSIFRVSILHIFLVCSYEKMLRVNAFPVVTFMQYMKTFRNFSIMPNPRESMGFNGFSFMGDSAVSLFIKRSSPVPAVFSVHKLFTRSGDLSCQM